MCRVPFVEIEEAEFPLSSLSEFPPAFLLILLGFVIELKKKI